ncbi:MAG: hypothetical protein FRX48_05796 [Lasallia pustulata]|uniref:Uncharacterized protein n=1 Tax=Lasallia pustulata TaxID=136370 RepID=A0A5M8PLM7_9LECA|nr:MAG: hypothetical protein FRX48_05796 [Lasallia pustulata]
MAQRNQTALEGQKEPHSVSLKVLRLSRPSFAQQYPLPLQDPESPLNSKAALSLPSGSTDDRFILSPVLTLPPSFGSAYVGELFSCTLCGNNELLSGDDRLITSTKIAAEMQTPSQTVSLDLIPADDGSEKSGMKAGQSVQKIVRFDLKEEGNHVLAVSLSYTETTMSKGESAASSGRVRTFRKLYQFIAQPCIGVRTKASELPSSRTGAGRSQAGQLFCFALEAQLENMADGPITLEGVTLEPRPPFKSSSLNWEVHRPDIGRDCLPYLAPRDVWQVAFLLEQKDVKDGEELIRNDLTKDGRTILGQLNVRWRSAMGDLGNLTTGWLTTKRR